MLDIKNFISAIGQIAEEKGIPQEKILEIIEVAIATAYKKDYGKKGQVIKAKLNPETGAVNFWQSKTVVDDTLVYFEEEKKEEELPKEGLDESREEKERREKREEMEMAEGKDESGRVKFNPEKHILLEEAKKENSKLGIGDELVIPLEIQEGYGRIAAQTAKQVLMQKIRESERECIREEYKSKEGEIVSGIVQRIENRNVFLDIGKTFGVLTREEQVPGEFYKIGQRLKVFVVKVEETFKGPVIFLSRAYPRLVSRLFELEVPEIADGQVEVKSIAREAGSRTKIAVFSSKEGIDPIGATVGQKGTRVMGVINELGGEKIDIIEYSEKPEKYVANALAPAKVVDVRIIGKNKVLAIVPEDQLSLAIGKEGQNVRLAAKLTGWKIDVKGENDNEGIERAEKAEAESQGLKQDAKKEEVKEEKKLSPTKPEKSLRKQSLRKRNVRSVFKLGH